MRADGRNQAELACVDAVELATDYLEGALAPKDAARFEHHLEICVGCMTYFEQIEALSQMLPALATDDFPTRIQRQLLSAFQQSRPA